MSTDHRRPRPPASCGLGPPEDFLSILLLRFELAYDFPPWIVPPTAVVYALFRCRPSSCRKNSPARLKFACDPAGAIELTLARSPSSRQAPGWARPPRANSRRATRRPRESVSRLLLWYRQLQRNRVNRAHKPRSCWSLSLQSPDISSLVETARRAVSEGEDVPPESLYH